MRKETGTSDTLRTVIYSCSTELIARLAGQSGVKVRIDWGGCRRGTDPFGGNLADGRVTQSMSDSTTVLSMDVDMADCSPTGCPVCGTVFDE